MTTTLSTAQRRIEFRNSTPGVGEVWIYDCIGIDPLTGGGITADNFRKELAALGDVRELHIFINSPGGDVFEAWGVITLLQRHPARKMVFVDGIAASAGSAIAMVGDTISIARHAMLMVHSAYVETDDIRESDRQALKRVNAQLIDLYARRTKIARSNIERMLAGETWFDSREAVQLGFADRIHEPTRAVASWRGELPRFGARRAPKELPGSPVQPEYKARYCLLADAPGRFSDWKSHALDVVWNRAGAAMKQDSRRWRTSVHEGGHIVFLLSCVRERIGIDHAIVHDEPQGGTLGYVLPKRAIEDDEIRAALCSAGHEAEILLGFMPGDMRDGGDGSDYRRLRESNITTKERESIRLRVFNSLDTMRSAIAHVAYLLFINRGKVRESTIEMHLREIDFGDHPDWFPILD